jgi:hypothetical protein
MGHDDLAPGSPSFQTVGRAPSHVQELSVRGHVEGPSQPEKLSLLATTEDRENAANESITRSHTPSPETA